GGDGTMLSIAVAAAQNKVPLLGINLGRLGYMTELETDEIPLLSSLKTNEFTVENRIMLSADVIRDGKKAASFTALNEILVCRGSVSRMIDLTLKCDSTSVAAYRADGIIAATPTGSTAYTMSAGGPIIDAKLKLICVCPICPHSFTGSRAIVFSPDSSLEISVSSQYNGDIYLTSDGREHTQIFYDDVVRISRSPLVTGLIKIKKNTFYETLYKKFNFGETI
ncbi:MAG: NAD(+)/NADH kinase, partial [Clostridia bacterium]